MPTGGDLRYNWREARLAALDEPLLTELHTDAWTMWVPRSVARTHLGTWLRSDRPASGGAHPAPCRLPARPRAESSAWWPDPAGLPAGAGGEWRRSATRVPGVP